MSGADLVPAGPRPSPDVLVVGGGCSGAAIAYHLKRLGAGAVTLLERSTLASGTTAQSSAIVRRHYSIPTLARMAHRSLGVFERFDELVGGEAGFRRTGLLIAARAEDLPGLRASVEMQQQLGIATQIVDRLELQTIEPRMACDDLAGACYEPEAGYADPTAVTHSFARQARVLGAVIRQGAEVVDLLVKNDRVEGVQLRGGERLVAGAVVVAAGIWGVPLLRTAGVDLPIHATRHPCIVLQRPSGFGPQHAILFDFATGLYLKPEGVDLTLAGTLQEDEAMPVADPDHFAALPTGDEAARLAERTAQRFPALIDATLQSGWAGLYDVSVDWQPVLGPVPALAGLYCALGFSGHGFKLCPVVGEIVAAQVLGAPPPPDLDLSLFSATRFAEGDLAGSRYAYGIIG